MKKTLWVVEQGSYSDYHVVGIFSTHEFAEQIAKIINGESHYDDATVAEWPLDPAVEEINAGLNQYLITMDYKGNVTRLERNEPSGYDIADGLDVWRRTEAPAWKGKPISDAVNGYVWARDDQHAAKIANEFRAQAIAEGRMKTRGEE